MQALHLVLVLLTLGLLLIEALVIFLPMLRAIVDAKGRLREMASTDALTGLANRPALRRRLEEALADGPLSGDAALLLLDLDRFKEVNDTMGHPVGDAVLREVARRLQGRVANGVVARLGGDEFAVVCPAKDDVEALAKGLVASLSQPYDHDGRQAVIGASIGIALAPDDGEEPERLLRRADVALYVAKAQGRGTARFYRADMDERRETRRRLEADLQAAVAHKAFEPHYQPQIDLRTGATIGFEALVRWRHPEHGLVLPGAFIEVAEETGLIHVIGAQVLRRACQDAAAWPGLRVAVNVSPAQFLRPDLPATVAQALHESGLAPERLELEITESMLIGNVDEARAAILRLKALGVHLAMDDFGTGYSCLSQLQSFPFDRVKIDRSFVAGLDHDAPGAAVVQAVIALGHGLGMNVIAEGIENAEQSRRVATLGCNEGQGFLFAKPMPVDEVAGWLLADPDAGTTAAAVERAEASA